MKKFVFALSALLLLASCAPAPSAPVSGASAVPEPSAVSGASQAAPVLPLTLASLREKYEKDGSDIRDVDGIEIGGPAVVHEVYALDGGAAIVRFEPERYVTKKDFSQSFFDFVELDTGKTTPVAHYHNLMIRKCTVGGDSAGYVLEIVTTGSNPATPALEFPTVVRFSGAKGTEAVTQEADESYSLPVGEPVTVGTKRPELLVDFDETIAGLELAFGAQAGKEADFFAGSVTIPLMEATFDGRICTVIMRDTVLSDALDPAATQTSGGYIDSMTLVQQGADAVLTMTLKDTVTFYRISEMVPPEGNEQAAIGAVIVF